MLSRCVLAGLFVALALVLTGAAEQPWEHGNNPDDVKAIDYRNPADPLEPFVEYVLNVVYVVVGDLEQTFEVGLESGLVPEVLGNLGKECVALAKESCGKGNICWLCVCENGDQLICQFGCRDADGGCEPAPPCCPEPDAASIVFLDL